MHREPTQQPNHSCPHHGCEKPLKPRHHNTPAELCPLGSGSASSMALASAHLLSPFLSALLPLCLRLGDPEVPRPPRLGEAWELPGLPSFPWLLASLRGVLLVALLLGRGLPASLPRVGWELPGVRTLPGLLASMRRVPLKALLLGRGLLASGPRVPCSELAATTAAAAAAAAAPVAPLLLPSAAIACAAVACAAAACAAAAVAPLLLLSAARCCAVPKLLSATASSAGVAVAAAAPVLLLSAASSLAAALLLNSAAVSWAVPGLDWAAASAPRAVTPWSVLGTGCCRASKSEEGVSGGCAFFSPPASVLAGVAGRRGTVVGGGA